MSQTTAPPWVGQVEAHDLMLEKTAGLEDLYVAAGNRLFMIGDQNGTFPPLGYHIPGDMGGIWSHPIKLLDGFWLKLTGPGGEYWLDKAEKFTVGPGFCEHHYTVPELGVSATRREWVPDQLPGVVVEFNLKNLRDVEIPLELEILIHSNLRPTWRAEELQIRDGEDQMEFLDELNAILAEDTINGWSVIFGTDRTPTYHLLGREITGRQESGGEHGSGGELHYSVDLPSRGWHSLRFFVAGAVESAAAARANYEDLVANHPIYFEEKMARYADVANHSRLKTPDAVIDEAYLWGKLNYEMLTVESPVGKGLVSGFPEFPSFSGVDIALNAGPALAAGRFALVKDSLTLLGTFAEKWHQNEDIPHEITTLGAPFQRTNQVALPLFVIALDQYLRWSGDRPFVSGLLPIAMSLQKRFTMDKPGLNMVPRGAGIVEKPGLGHRMVDVGCFLLESMRALESILMGLNLTDHALLPWLRRKSDELDIAIQRTFWMKENTLFADMCAPTAEIQKLIDRHVARAKGSTAEQWDKHLPRERVELAPEEAVPEGVMYGWLGRHWISTMPFFVGAASYEQAAKAFPKLESGYFMSPWGMMVQGGVDKKVTPLGSGVLACSQIRYGRGDQGVQTIKRMALSLKHEMPGTFAEYLPDQGCFLRAWSGLGIIWSMVWFVLGIRPNLGNRTMDFVPSLPQSWPEVFMDDLRLGSSQLSFRARHGAGWGEAIIAAEERGPTTYAAMPVPHGLDVVVKINDHVIRKWDIEERKVNGRRYVGMKIETVPGVHVLRVEYPTG